MEQKRFSPLKLVAAIIFILLAGYSAINFVGNFISAISELFDGRVYFMLLGSDLLFLAVSGLQILGFLLLAVSCFTRKPRLLGIAGVAALIVALLFSGLGSITNNIIFATGIVQFRHLINVLLEYPGRILRSLLDLHTLIYLITLLLSGLGYVAAAVVLLLDKKGNKIMSLIPSVFAILAPVWNFLACAVVGLIAGRFSFNSIVSLFVGSGFGQGLLIAAGFALLLLSTTAKEKAAVVEEPRVVEEASVQEEIPAAEEVPAE